MKNVENTLIFLKPDALRESDLACQVLERILDAGFALTRAKLVSVTEEKILRHYEGVVREHGEVMRKKILNYFFGTKIFVMVATRENAVARMRELIGATDPSKAARGTIRGDLARDSLAQAMKEERFVNNLIHASDSPESMLREMSIWLDA